MARIVSVYHPFREPFELREMACIRWLKIAEALARRGHQVDIATNEPEWQSRSDPVIMAPNLRRVPIEGLRWSRYEVVKTVFHLGFETLDQYRGASHQFIISKLGSVVGSKDMPGIHFFGDIRERLYATQMKIHKTSRYVTVLSPAARELWVQCHGARPGILLVPGGVDRELPPAGSDPYRSSNHKVCLFAGNIYDNTYQPEANRVLSEKLNALGKGVADYGIRVCFLGIGDVSLLDPRWVTNLGSVSYEESWDYLRFASVGIVVSAGSFMHNNESSKIYHYLRAGLPVVSEEGFPNDHVVRDSGRGFVVPSGDMEAMAARICQAAAIEAGQQRAIDFVIREHSWDRRVETYEPVLPVRSAPWWRRLRGL